MRTYTTVRLRSGDRGFRAEDAARVTEILEENVDLGMYYVAADVTNDEQGILFEHESRWTLDGLHDAAEEISAEYKDVIVEVSVTWDSRDADEQGEELTLYRGGEELATGTGDVVLRDKRGNITNELGEVTHLVIPVERVRVWHKLLLDKPFPDIASVAMDLARLLP